MKNLKKLLKQPLKIVPNSLAIFLLIIAFIGFIDAGYLTVNHFQNVVPPCSIVAGCESVLTSSYAVIFGIPIALVGAIYYLLVLIGVSAFLESKNVEILKWTLFFTLIGFLSSLWLIYIQAFILNSYCLYCLGSALTSTILFVTSMEVLRRYQID